MYQPISTAVDLNWQNNEDQNSQHSADTNIADQQLFNPHPDLRNN